MKRLLEILFVFLLLNFFLVLPAKAADLNIDCPGSTTACSKSGLDPLFSNDLDGFWYPGKTITKTLNLKNSGSQTREMAIRGTRTSAVNILENVMNISIVGGTTVIWSGSVADFYGQDKIGMGIFAPGTDLNYNFTIFMSSSADNNYQNKETVFDLTLGFWEEPLSSPTPAPATGGTGGAVLGAGASAPVCNDAKPGSAPTLLSAVGGVNSVTLTWSLANVPVSYYLVSYGLSSGIQTYGNPNVGDSDTTSYVVNNLSGGTTYYFKVRAGNGCMPGDYSNELSATPTGGIVIGPATGFTPGVLGTATEASPLPSSGEILGQQAGFNFNWIFGLLALGLIFLLLKWGGKLGRMN